jgi:adenylate cyclase
MIADRRAHRQGEGRARMTDIGADRLVERILAGTLSESDAHALSSRIVEHGPAMLAPLGALLRRCSLMLELVKVSESLSLDSVLPRLIEIITEALEADRATLFLHDSETDELFSRVARGDDVAEIRIPRDAGIVGAVFNSGAAEIIPDAYADRRFNQEVDRRTGYVTRSILCVPLRNRDNQVVGATQVLNKKTGIFTEGDRALLEAIAVQASSALENAHLFERVERAQKDEGQLLQVTEWISSELQLDRLLGLIVTAVTTLLNAERSTLFVHDPKTSQLWSRVAEGAEAKEIRIPVNAGIAGAAFSGGTLLNIPHAYADPRFNQDVDRRTGYRTRSILAVPVADRTGKAIGVVQVLNKRGGPFSAQDERRLKAFGAQIAIALQNAQLFAEVLSLKNYNESILKSLSDGVVTLDEDGVVIKVNEAAVRILGRGEDALVGATADALFAGENDWVLKSLGRVAESGKSDYSADIDYRAPAGAGVAVNLTVTPLFSVEGRHIGSMLILEDITREKRMRGTMARYMAKEVVDKLLTEGEEVLAGASTMATVLFSDIRRFTTIAENLTARETVLMLNSYFSEMVEIIIKYGGVLDKYIGDAIMANFGAPLASDDDAGRAVQVANEMFRALRVFNARRHEAGLPAIEIGVGLATGEVLAGSIGSQKRLEYTVIGDSVNLASRLEGATKQYGTPILVDGVTVERMRDKGRIRQVDLIRVKGKARPTEIYESLDHYSEEIFPHLDRVLALFEEGLRDYRGRDWRSALRAFGEALELAPKDGPSAVYRNRCGFYLENPPPPHWDGVWTMAEK